jgi:hypothetical protein
MAWDRGHDGWAWLRLAQPGVPRLQTLVCLRHLQVEIQSESRGVIQVARRN